MLCLERESKLTSFAFPVSALTILRPGLPDVTTLSMPAYLCTALPERSVQITTLIPLALYLVHAYILAMTLHMHTKGRFNNLHCALLVQDPSWHQSREGAG